MGQRGACRSVRRSFGGPRRRGGLYVNRSGGGRTGTGSPSRGMLQMCLEAKVARAARRSIPCCRRPRRRSGCPVAVHDCGRTRPRRTGPAADHRRCRETCDTRYGGQGPTFGEHGARCQRREHRAGSVRGAPGADDRHALLQPRTRTRCQCGRRRVRVRPHRHELRGASRQRRLDRCERGDARTGARRAGATHRHRARGQG